LTPKTILLASHGTAGARAAEQTTLDLCVPGCTICHLEVVPDFWKGMRGDDWLNNAITLEKFGEYVESQLQRELAEHAETLCREVKGAGAIYMNIAVVGKPAESLLAVAAARNPQLVVIGSPRPRGMPGYSSRMKVEILMRTLRVPLLIAPHPCR